LRPGGPLGENGGSSVGKGGERVVESRDLQGGSPRPCRLSTDGLAPRASIERTDHMLDIWAQ
jgi:hypothetical protein